MINVLNQIGNGLCSYYNHLQTTIQNEINSKQQHKIFATVQNIQGSQNFSVINNNLSQLLTLIDQANQNQNGGKKKLDQESIMFLISQSNQSVYNSTIGKVQDICKQMIKCIQKVNQVTNNTSHIFSRDVFHFSSTLKAKEIWINQANSCISKSPNAYRAILMEPSIRNSGKIAAFKFKIKRAASNWISIGMGYRKVFQKNNFTFDYAKIGHGSYMISTNGGSWSSISEALNNKVKAFTFSQNDIITCIVNKSINTIFFIKEVDKSVGQVPISQRQVYQLSYQQVQNDQLHPCVVYYYQNDQVEYIPVIDLSTLPKIEYLFNQSSKHPKLQVIHNRLVKSIDTVSQYRSAILNKTLEYNYNTSKKFAFKIVHSSNNWIAVGMCHYNTVLSSKFGFNYSLNNHGYYMISSNGGTWSCIDPKKNNIISAFKFSQGQIIECQVIFGDSPQSQKNRIIFRKNIEKYQLNFIGIPGDKLYPCVMLYYSNDQVSIIPAY